MFHRKQPEDTVLYRLYPKVDPSSQLLGEKRDEYLGFLSQWLIDYIWQNDTFHLNIVEGSLINPDHLSGIVNVGDNIDDEWFIVYLLLSISEIDRDLIVQVCDSDGEFLLIEAADSLPSWLEPETAENRVWLHRGEIHIIPKPDTVPDTGSFPRDTPTLEEAIRILRCHGDKTRAAAGIQKAIRAKIEQFKKDVSSNQHRAHGILPHRSACILQRCPQLVSTAVYAFYYRDALDMKACRNMKFFKPDDLVKTSVLMTRCQYAQLVQQKFTPDRQSGWDLGLARDPGRRARELGMKLSHGLEIAASRVKKFEAAQTAPFSENSPAYKRFHRRLLDIGYFKGELPGSRLYKELLEKAITFFVNEVAREDTDLEEPGVRIRRLLCQENCPCMEKLKGEENSLLPEDDDSWMDVAPGELDAMLSAKAAEYFPTKGAKGDVTTAMRQFMTTMSGVEGAELPNESLEDEEEDDGPSGVGSLIKSMTEELTIKDDPFGGDSSSDAGLDDYASDLSSDEERARGDEMSELAHKKQSKEIRDQMREMRRYMNQMDKELKGSDVMKGFKLASPPKRGQAEGKKTKTAKPVRLAEAEDFGDDMDSLSSDSDERGAVGGRRIDLDKNLAENWHQSYAAQMGEPGPSGTLLHAMGVPMNQRTSQVKPSK